MALILAIAYTPWGNRIFGCAPIGWDVWLFILPFAFAMLVLEEGRKGWVRRRGQGGDNTLPFPQHTFP